jgi:hypothetical protein
MDRDKETQAEAEKHEALLVQETLLHPGWMTGRYLVTFKEGALAAGIQA